MVYERHVRTISGLEKELEVLDGDAGVRVEGRYAGRKCFAFVTRFDETYTVMVYSAKEGSKRAPGKNLLSKEFANLEGLLAFLASMATPKVDAYVY